MVLERTGINWKQDNTIFRLRNLFGFATIRKIKSGTIDDLDEETLGKMG